MSQARASEKPAPAAAPSTAAMLTMVATTRWVTKPPLSRITLTGLPSRANRACAALRMSTRVAGLVASTRRLVAASSTSMSMPMVRAGSSRSTTATVVTSNPRGATKVMAWGEGDAPVSMVAPRSLSNWYSSMRREARGETHTGGMSCTTGTGGSAGTWAAPST